MLISEYIKSVTIPKKFVATFLSIIVFVVSWTMISKCASSPAVPSIIDILKEMPIVLSDDKFILNLLSTMKILLYGIVSGCLVGVVLAVCCSLYVNIGLVADRLIHALRTIPAIALFPLILAVLGIGDESRVFIIFWTAMPPTFISTLFGLNNVDASVIEASEVSGANKYTIMRRIKFPLSIIEMLNGVKISIGTGFISSVTAEMLGANKGIGYMILWETNSFKYCKVYCYIFVVAILGCTANYIIDKIIKLSERKLFE